MMRLRNTDCRHMLMWRILIPEDAQLGVLVRETGKILSACRSFYLEKQAQDGAHAEDFSSKNRYKMERR
jgi:hypothetical protein